MVPHTDDGRVLFVIPWHGRVLVGTTDTPMPEPEIEPRPLAEEIEFILRNAARYLAEATDSRADVLCVFAGQRPLVYAHGHDEHEGDLAQPRGARFRAGLVTIVGGKWTTYRKMAEDTIDHAIQVGGLAERACVTQTSACMAGWSRPETPADPMRIYGADLAACGRLDGTTPASPRRCIRAALPAARVVWAARHEMARTVEDVLARRTRSLLLDARASIDGAPARRRCWRASSAATRRGPTRRSRPIAGSPPATASLRPEIGLFLGEEKLAGAGELGALLLVDLRVLEVQRGQRVDDRGGDDGAREPLVVGRARRTTGHPSWRCGGSCPRRPPCSPSRSRAPARRRRRTSSSSRIVDPLEESLLLLLGDTCRKNLRTIDAVAGEVALEVR